MSKKTYIPKVDRKILIELAAKIRPLFKFDGVLYFIKPQDIFNVSYIWEPVKDKKASNLEQIKDITTYHGFNYYGFFKPSVSEVLAQIPKKLINQVTAFEIINRPLYANDLNREKKALDNGYHVATTRLYKIIS